MGLIEIFANVIFIINIHLLRKPDAAGCCIMNSKRKKFQWICDIVLLFKILMS